MRRSKGLISFLVLALMKEKPRYGYELMEKFEEISGGYWQLGQGTVYGALEGLEEEGLIETIDSPNSENETNRQYYAITDEGHNRYEQIKEEGQEKMKAEERILGLLYVYEFLAEEDKFRNLLEAIKEEFFPEKARR